MAAGGGEARPGWLVDLVLALLVEPDLRPEDPAFARALVSHSPTDRARVWIHADGGVRAVSQHPQDLDDGAAVRAHLERAVLEDRAIVGDSVLFPLPEVGALEITGVALSPDDLDAVAVVARRFAERARGANLLDSIVENLPDMVFVKDADELRFVLLNRAGEELLGFDRQELFGRNDHDFFPAEEADFFTDNDRAVLASGEVLDVPEEPIHTANGARTLHTKKIPIKGVDGHPRYLLGISRDITERTRMEKRLLQSQRLEAVVQLAAGLAHDVNNAAMIISGYADLSLASVRSDPRSQPKVVSYLEKLGRASRRITNLANRLLSFARTKAIEPSLTDVGTMLLETTQIIRPLISEAIALDTGAIETGCFAQIDRAQFEQVLVNLAVNARDAMESGGELRISVRVDADPGGVGGRWVVLEVSDTGHGMSEDVRERACEPFFSTKRAGHGSGLGLYSASQIVGIHGGRLEIDSTAGAGTTVRILIPAVDGPELRADPTPSPRSALPDNPGDETVMVVEDDPELRAVVAGGLEARGYTVVTAGDGVEALELLARDDAPEIELLLSDVVMPRMGGPELAARVREQHPTLPVILVSGHTAQAVEHLASDPSLVILAKPIPTTELATAVRQLLDR
jgi:PAS domain S-box-containing protein